MVKSLDGEWDEHSKRLEGYNSRDQNARRYAIFLPEKVYETFHFVYLRNASASMSIALQMFIERNKDRMLDAISDRTTLL